MPYQYDEMGNVVGEYETEDERRKKLAQSAQTGQTAPVAPVAPPPANNAFNRIQQIESGGRDYNAQGQPLTSPKGAMFANQVMPATAANPGFGVKPASAQTPEEYNRVGRELWGALLNKFGGDEQKAAAAYNAGYGRVSQNIAANNGQMNVGQLPKETQGYLQKFGNAVSSVIPSAQAAPAPRNVPQAFPQEGVAVATGRGVQGTMTGPVPPTEENAQPAQQNQYSLGTGRGNEGINIPGLTPLNNMPGMGPDTTQQAIGRYQLLQDDQNGMFKMAFDETQPEYLRQRAKERGVELYNQQRQEEEAKKKLATISPTEAARAIEGKDKSNIGGWLQYLLYKHVGLEDLANTKAEELGIGHNWENATITDEKGNERSVEIQRTKSGRVLKGKFTGPDGADLAPDQLEQATAGILGKGVHINKTDTYIDPATAQVVNHQTLSNGKERWMSGGKPFTGDASKLVLEHAFTANENSRVQNVLKALESQYTIPTAQQKFDALRRAGVPTRRIESEIGVAPGSLEKGVATQPQAQTQPTAVAAPPATQQTRPGYVPPKTSADELGSEPEPRAGETKDAYKARVADWQKKKDRLEKRIEALPKTEQNSRNTIELLDNLINHPGFETSVGVRGPTGVLQLRGTDARAWTALHEQLTNQQFLSAYETLRGAGHITDVEGDKATKAIAALKDTGISEAEFKKNAETYKTIIKRGINRERESLGYPPLYGDVKEANESNMPKSSIFKEADAILNKKK